MNGKYDTNQRISYQPKYGNLGGRYPLPPKYNTTCPVCSKKLGPMTFKNNTVSSACVFSNVNLGIWFICHNKCKKQVKESNLDDILLRVQQELQTN